MRSQDEQAPPHPRQYAPQAPSCGPLEELSAPSTRKVTIGIDVAPDHAPQRKALSADLPACLRVDFRGFRDCLRHLADATDDEPGPALIDSFRQRSMGEADDRRATGNCFA